MVDVQIQPHPDGVGGHQIVHVPILVEFHLRIAGAWAERPHHHSGAAFLTADQFGEGIYIVNRKPNNCGAGFHARDFARAGVF